MKQQQLLLKLGAAARVLAVDANNFERHFDSSTVSLVFQ